MRAILFFIVMCLITSLSQIEVMAVDTEKALFIIHNKTPNVITYNIEYLNHGLDISPFEKFVCAGGEIQPGASNDIDLKGYPLGAVLKVIVWMKEPVYFRYREMLKEEYTLTSIKGEFNIYVKDYK